MSDGEKKVAKAKKPADHPVYAEMIATAISTLKERNGSSGIAIKKYIKANYKVKDNADVFIRGGLKKGVEKGTLTQVKGNGASGSFKVTKVEKPKKVKKTPKKPAAKKPASSKESHTKEEASSKESHPKEEGSCQEENPSKESCKGKEIDLLLQI